MRVLKSMAVGTANLLQVNEKFGSSLVFTAQIYKYFNILLKL
jgi:hypothetical protein